MTLGLPAQVAVCVDPRKPAALVSIGTEGGVAASVNQGFVEPIGLLRMLAHEPGSSKGKDAGGFLAAIRQ